MIAYSPAEQEAHAIAIAESAALRSGLQVQPRLRFPLTANLLSTSDHPKQELFVGSDAKRIIVRAGRRGGKTVGVGIRSVKRFLKGRRQLYAAPTQEQIHRYWITVCRMLRPSIDAGLLVKNETYHTLEVPGTEQRIRAKTAWNADSLRGDYADDLYLDEWQLMNEDAWGLVGAPMLLDNDGDVVFIYTPPSLHSRSVSKANDPQHAAKLYKKFKKRMEEGNPRYAAFHFTSHDNPHLSTAALDEIAGDMTALAYRMEIGAEDVDEAPGALWTRKLIESLRAAKATGDYSRVVVGVDPSNTSGGDEAGIITVGRVGTRTNGIGHVIEDSSVQGSPKMWASAAVTAYHKHGADCIVAESNNGGEMVALTIETVDPKVKVKLVHASRGKQTRAEPIASHYEHGRARHLGSFSLLEDEMCLWEPGQDSPNRMDAMVWGMTELLVEPGPKRILVAGPLSSAQDSGCLTSTANKHSVIHNPSNSVILNPCLNTISM